MHSQKNLIAKLFFLICLLLCYHGQAYSQDSHTADINLLSNKKEAKKIKQKKAIKQQQIDQEQVAKKLEEADMNILFSYYAQDGNNSPVTGGYGTEQLTDLVTVVSVNVPINEKNSISALAGFDYYTSASSDKIDRFVSSASVRDVRAYASSTFTRKNPAKGITYGFKLGGSVEYDYTSIQYGAHFSKTSKDGNRSLSLSGQVFNDIWSIIYPEELRGQGRLVDTDKRQSFSGTATYTQVLNKRMQVALTADVIYQQGLLSTPFHRVYFQGQELPKIEKLPGSRVKLPVGLRFNYYINDYLLTRMFYRYYWDDWGVKGHTFEVEAPIKITRFMSVYPVYRFHTQTGARYFKPYGAHTLDQLYYTSDTDLAKLHSHKIGLGLRFSPSNGIARMKIPFVKKRNQLTFKGIDLRYGHYLRSTGLKADIISLGMNFSF